MAYSVDFASNLIEVTFPQAEVLAQDLINAIRDAEASEKGILYGQIARASGKETLGPSVAVGITVELLGDWQLHFWPGNYIAKVAGGNLVGGPGSDPIAYSAGVQVLLIQSAASTVIATGGGGAAGALTQAQEDALYAAVLEANKARKMLTNKAVISVDKAHVTVYDDDGTTVLHEFDISADKLTRTPA